MATQHPTVRCPGCNRPQPLRGPDAIYWCEHCRCQYDADPEEGGDYSTYDPAWRIERAEARAKNSKPR